MTARNAPTWQSAPCSEYHERRGASRARGAEDKDRGEVMVDRITEMFYEESIDHVYAYGEPEDASWERSLDQSEDAAATVVHI